MPEQTVPNAPALPGATGSVNRRHLARSWSTTPLVGIVYSGVGRVAVSLCGRDVGDQDWLNHRRDDRAQARVAIEDLPLCGLCAKAAARG